MSRTCLIPYVNKKNQIRNPYTHVRRYLTTFGRGELDSRLVDIVDGRVGVCIITTIDLRFHEVNSACGMRERARAREGDRERDEGREIESAHTLRPVENSRNDSEELGVSLCAVLGTWLTLERRSGGTSGSESGTRRPSFGCGEDIDSVDRRKSLRGARPVRFYRDG